VLYGENEAGKTTLREFVRLMLFGPSEETGPYCLQPVSAEISAEIRSKVASLQLFGGEIELNHDGQRLAIRRQWTEGGIVRQDSETPESQGCRAISSVREFLPEGIPLDLIRRLYVVDLREMQTLSLLSREELAELLFRTSTSLLGVPLSWVLAKLEDTERTLLGSEDGVGGFWEVGRRVEDAVGALKSLRQEHRQATALAARVEELRAEENQLQSELGRIEGELSCVQRALEVYPLWEEICRTRNALDSLAGLPPRISQIATRAESLQRRADTLGSVGERLREEIARLESSLEGLALPADARLIQRRLERLLARERFIFSLEARRAEAQGRQQRFRGLWDRSLESISCSCRESLEKLLRLRPRHKRRLGQLARQMVAKADQWDQLVSARDEAERQWTETRESLCELLNRSPPESLPQQIEELSRRVQQLRQRLVQSHRRGELEELAALLEEEYRRLTSQQPVGRPWRFALRGIFWSSLSAVLGSVVLPWGWGTWGWPLLGLGGVGLSSAILLRYFLESSHWRKVEAARQQLEQVGQSLRHDGGRNGATGNVREPAPTAPEVSGSGGPEGTGNGSEVAGSSEAAELASAEKELRRLQALAPQLAELNRKAETLSSLNQQVDQLHQELEGLNEQWQTILESAGILAGLRPEELLALLPRLSRLRRLRAALVRAERKAERLSARQREWAERLALVGRKLGLNTEEWDVWGLALSERLVALRQTGLELDRRLEEARRLQSKRRKLREKHTQVQERSEGIQKRLDRLLRSCRVPSLEALRRLAAQAAEAEQLRHRLAELEKQLEGAVSGPAAAEIRQMIMHLQRDEILRRQAELQQQRGQLREALEKVRHSISQCQEEQASLSAPEKWWAMRAEWKLLKRQRRLLLGQALQTKLLRKALLRAAERFQRDYQPEALRFASGLLAAMTCGRYQRIWAPLDRQILWIEDSGGRRWTADQLSQGTCEQIFLALRLALVTLLSRRGAKFPLLLDDVLVNFDARRVVATARAVVQWAGSWAQVLLFTCHPHIVRAFAQLEVPVFRLPGPGESCHSSREGSTLVLRPRIRRTRGAGLARANSSDERSQASTDKPAAFQPEGGRVSPASETVQDDSPEALALPGGQTTSEDRLQKEELRAEQADRAAAGLEVEPAAAAEWGNSGRGKPESLPWPGGGNAEKISAGKRIRRERHRAESLPHLRVFRSPGQEEEEEALGGGLLEAGLPFDKDRSTQLGGDWDLPENGSLGHSSRETSSFSPELDSAKEAASEGRISPATPPGIDPHAGRGSLGDLDNPAQTMQPGIQKRQSELQEPPADVGPLAADLPEGAAFAGAAGKEAGMAEKDQPRGTGGPVLRGSSRKKGNQEPKQANGRGPRQRSQRSCATTPDAPGEPAPSPTAKDEAEEKLPSSQPPGKERQPGIRPRVEYYGNHQGSYDSRGRLLGPTAE
jgi:uncharacterized protein YhaN